MFDKKEHQILKKRGFKFVEPMEFLEILRELRPSGKIKIHSLFVFVSDTRRLHDSGYPFIRIFGEIDGKRLIDLGWHDHYLIEFPVNVEAYGKNVFHIMPWGRKPDGFWIRGDNFWCSTFEIENTGELR